MFCFLFSAESANDGQIKTNTTVHCNEKTVRDGLYVLTLHVLALNVNLSKPSLPSLTF